MAQFVSHGAWTIADKHIWLFFSSRPNPEKFYGCCLASVPAKASTYFPSLSPHAATVTIMKFAELLLVYHKQSSVTNVQEKSKAAQPLSGRDIDSLQYLGGYILRNILRKLKKSSKVDSSESQQMIAVLEASQIKDVRGWQFLTMKAAETLCIVCLPPEKHIS